VTWIFSFFRLLLFFIFYLFFFIIFFFWWGGGGGGVVDFSTSLSIYRLALRYRPLRFIDALFSLAKLLHVALFQVDTHVFVNILFSHAAWRETGNGATCQQSHRGGGALGSFDIFVSYALDQMMMEQSRLP
jgi:hypothetical protein